MDQINIKIESPTPIWCDNESAIIICNDGPFSKRSRHYDLAIHKIREMVRNNLIKIKFVRTNEQPADVFTKPLEDKLFWSWMSDIMGSISLQITFSDCVKNVVEIEVGDDSDQDCPIRERKMQEIIEKSRKDRIARKRAKAQKKK